MDALPYVVFQKEYNNLNAAKDAVKRNDVWGLIYFASNYSSALAQRITLAEDLDDLTINLSEVNVWQDMSSECLEIT